MSAVPYPVHVRGELDEPLSRGLWLVKWLLALPHYVVLLFLWVAFVVLSIVAWFAILFTGRYPRALFDFNVGVMRWTWRVNFYAYSALGTDRYPPFTFAEVADYPAGLTVDYPDHLSRGLVLVKSWLLAIPHYLVVGIFAGGGLWVGQRVADSDVRVASSPSLIGIVVLIAAVALLFTGRYPHALFDFALGMNRWALRVGGYAALMTDDYPPFRLDMGGADPDAAGAEAVAASSASSTAGTQGWTTGRIVTAVFGAVAVLASIGLAIGGAVLAVVDQGVRDSDDYLMSGEKDFVTSSYAIASENVELHTAKGADSVPRKLLGDIKVEVTALTGGDLFIGIARTSDAEAYLAGVGHATVTDITSDGDPVYRDVLGGPPASDPATSDIWVAEASGPGTLSVEWTPERGDWTVVVMNADGSAGVAVTASAGATVPVLTAVWVILLVVGGIGLVIGAVLLIVSLTRAQRTG